MDTFDSQGIEFPCPHCSGKLAQSVAELKSHKHIICQHCGQAIAVGATQFKAEIAKAEQALAQFRQAISRLGK